MGTNQTRPAQRIDYTDPQRDTSGQDTGSSFDVASGELDALLPAVLVSNDHMDTVLADDVGVSAARISNMTANDKLHSILEFVKGGGTIDYGTLFGLQVPV